MKDSRLFFHDKGSCISQAFHLLEDYRACSCKFCCLLTVCLSFCATNDKINNMFRSINSRGVSVECGIVGCLEE